MAHQTSIRIPMHQSAEVVEVPVDELPEDPADIITILSTEMAPLHVWLECAVQYYKHGNPTAFEKILSVFAGKDAAPERHHREDKSALVAILNTLAAYYTRLARLTSDKAKKKDFNIQATQLFNKADKIDIHEEITWVGKGISQLFQGSDDRAMQQFRTVLDQNPDNIPALLGKACILYRKGDHVSALNLFKKVIQLNPNCPPSVRVGLAYCYSKLKKFDLAKLALQRALELETDNDIRVDALINLAILESNDGQVDLHNKHVTEAHSVDGNNSKVLNRLSDDNFRKGEYEKSVIAARRGFHNSTIDQVQAESLFFLARVAHAKGEYPQALNYYQQSVTKWGDFPLSRFGLGQMYLHKQDIDKAKQEFEKVLELVPDNPDSMKILGSLYIKSGNHEKAIELLKRANQRKTADLETIIELAQLLETAELSDALHAYKESVKLYNKQNIPVPSEVWNNIGVLEQQLGNYGEAENSYHKALVGDFGEIPVVTDGHSSELQENPDSKALTSAPPHRTRWKLDEVLDSPQGSQLLQATNVTTTYNLARLYEADFRFKVATKLYKAILAQYPNYTDCYMRLGYMCRDKEERLTAEDWFKETLTLNNPERYSEAWSSMANLDMDKKLWNQAQKRYELVLQRNRTDPYVLLQLGNIFVQSARQHPEKQSRYLKVAEDYFITVLKRDKSNAFAANGLAIVLKEKGYLAEAEDFLMQVREAAPDIPDVWINLASINMVQGQYDNAIRIYESVLREFYAGSDATIFLYIAKAAYESGKFDLSKSVLQKAIHLTPWDIDLWYNLAIVLKNRAEAIRQDAYSTAEKMKSAINDYQAAIPMFQKLANPDNTAKRGYSTKKCSRFLSLCTSNMESAVKKYTELESMDKGRLQAGEEKRKKAQMLADERRRREEEEIQREQQRKLQLEREAEAIKMRTEELQKAWQEREEERAIKRSKTQARKKRKSKGGDDEEANPEDAPMGSDDEDKNYDMEAEQPKQKKKKRKRAAEEDEDNGGSPQDEEEKPAKPKKSRIKKKKRVSEEQASTSTGGERNGIMDADDDLLLGESDDDGGEKTKVVEGEDDDAMDNSS